MKRIISLCCICLILVTSMAAPVRADDFINEFNNVLDFSSVNSEGNFFSFSGSTSINLDLPSRYTISYVDILFESIGNSVTAVTSDWYSQSSSLTLISVGDNIYRAYGHIILGDYRNLTFTFTNDGSSTSYVDLVSCRVSALAFSSFDIEAYCDISSYGYNNTIHYVPTDEINYRIFLADGNDITSSGYSLFLHSDDWKKYDYIDFLISLTVDSVNSIACTIGGVNVPLSVSYISNDVMTNNDYTYSIRLDLRNIDRSIDDFPLLIITGNLSLGHQNLVSILSCVGLVDQSLSNNSSLFRAFINFIESKFLSLDSWISSQTFSLQSSLDTIYRGLVDYILDHIERIEVAFSNLNDNIDSNFNNLSSWILSQTYDLQSSLETIYYGLIAHLSEYTDRLESAIRGDTAPGDSFQDEVDQKDQQMDEMAAVMDSVQKPDIDQINVSVDQYVSQADIQVLASPMAVFFEGEFFSQVIIMSILLATVSYVLYGKR